MFRSAGPAILQYAVDWDDAAKTFGGIRRVLERSGCPVAFSLVQQNGFPENWKQVLAMTAAANDDGLPISVQVMPRAIGMLPLTGSTNAEHLQQDLASRDLELPAELVRGIEAMAG